MKLYPILFMVLLATITLLLMGSPVATSAISIQKISLSSFSCSNVSEIPQSECQALVAIYQSTNGSGWFDSTSWLNTVTPCTWRGVYCNEGHVAYLFLSSNNLTGYIPSEIGNLPALKVIDLTWNYGVGGSLPAELGHLKNLEKIDLHHNVLTGVIPPELGEVTKLERLDLSYNRLTGTIPPELGHIISLKYLSFGSNQLDGGIPGELGNLSNLEWLSLHHNQLTGTIPPNLGLLMKLKVLDISHNQLSDNIPVEVGNLTNLVLFNLDSNQLSGRLPSSIANLSHLGIFDMSRTTLCEPSDSTFQAWLSRISNFSSTGIICDVTPTSTPTPEMMPTPIATQPPYIPENPVPADATKIDSLSPALSWSGGDANHDPLTYTVAFGTSSPPPIVTVVTMPKCNPSGGSGGLSAGVYETTVAGVPAKVVVGKNYDPQKPTHLVFYLHSDAGEYQASPSSVFQLIQQNGWIYVAPLAPAVGSGPFSHRWYWNPYQNIDLFSRVIDEMFSKYNICRDLIFGSSASGGSVFYDRYFFPHRAKSYPIQMVLSCGSGGLEADASLSEDDLVLELGKDRNIVVERVLQYNYGTEDFDYEVIQRSMVFYLVAGFRVVNNKLPDTTHCRFDQDEGNLNFLEMASVRSPRFSYALSTLQKSTKYYWQVTASDGISETIGPIWSFETVANVPTATPTPAPGSTPVFDTGVYLPLIQQE